MGDYAYEVFLFMQGLQALQELDEEVDEIIAGPPPAATATQEEPEDHCNGFCRKDKYHPAPIIRVLRSVLRCVKKVMPRLVRRTRAHWLRMVRFGFYDVYHGLVVLTSVPTTCKNISWSPSGSAESVIFSLVLGFSIGVMAVMFLVPKGTFASVKVEDAGQQSGTVSRADVALSWRGGVGVPEECTSSYHGLVEEVLSNVTRSNARIILAPTAGKEVLRCVCGHDGKLDFSPNTRSFKSCLISGRVRGESGLKLCGLTLQSIPWFDAEGSFTVVVTTIATESSASDDGSIKLVCFDTPYIPSNSTGGTVEAFFSRSTVVSQLSVEL